MNIEPRRFADAGRQNPRKGLPELIRSIFWILVFSVMPKRSLLVGAVLSAFLFGTEGNVTDGVYSWVPSAAAAPVVNELKSFAGEDGKEYRFGRHGKQ